MSIRYAKENDREKRERKKARRRDIEREGEIREIEREREVKGIDRERVKGRVQSSYNLPNREIKRKQRLITQNYRSKLLHKIIKQTYYTKYKQNYYTKLLNYIITQNYHLVYYVAQKL